MQHFILNFDWKVLHSVGPPVLQWCIFFIDLSLFKPTTYSIQPFNCMKFDRTCQPCFPTLKPIIKCQNLSLIIPSSSYLFHRRSHLQVGPDSHRGRLACRERRHSLRGRCRPACPQLQVEVQQLGRNARCRVGAVLIRGSWKRVALYAAE